MFNVGDLAMSAPRQRFNDVAISAVAHAEAPVVVTSASIEAEIAETLVRLEVAPGLLASLAGIRERRFWNRGTMPSDAATEAGENLLANCEVNRESIGVLINTSVSHDFVEPATASIVHHKLGLGRNCMSFDLGNACAGFINGINVAASFIERGDIDHALIVDGEDARRVVEATIERLRADTATRELFREQFATLTLGSAGGAVLVSRRGRSDGAHVYRGGLSVSASEYAYLSRGQVDEGRTDTQALLAAGLNVAKDGWDEAVAAFGWDDDNVDMYVVHQVSAVHTDALIATLGLRSEKVPRIYQTHGNVGPAAIPLLLSTALNSGGTPSGRRIVLMAIGSGISAVAAEVIW